jgi:hypothetical protein
MDSRTAPDVMTGWIYARNFLGELYECEYLADTWPERLELDDLAALQSVGKDYPVFEAWKICLKKAAESLELVTGKEFWWLGSDEPSEYWTRKKQRKVLIPPCHKPKGDDDDILFFGGGALERDTVSPQEFAGYLNKHNKQPSKYIAAWFSAYGVDVDLKPAKVSKKQRKPLKPKGRDRTEGTQLIYELLSHYKIEYSDQLSGNEAWWRIVSGEFSSNRIEHIEKNKRSITLKGDGQLDRQAFLERYRKRF